MKHTPGPWRIENGSSGIRIFGGHTECAMKEDFAPICVMRWSDGMNKTVESLIYSNARLIASAPEMLEALKKCEIHLFHVNVNLEFRKNIESIIARAEGKE